MFSPELRARAEALLDSCRRDGRTVATAESCTGGLIAALLTDIAGSSDVFERGFVTYSNAAKIALLGVPEALLAAHGAVSAPAARAMAAGALERSQASVAISVTGIAGPGGAAPGKPVGSVFLARASQTSGSVVERRNFEGDRAAVRLASLEAALTLLESAP